MDLEEIMQYTELLDEAETFKPIVKKIIEVIKSYSEELKDLIDPFGDYLRNNRVKGVKFYESEGFTRQEAMLMSMHDGIAIKELLENFTPKK